MAAIKKGQRQSNEWRARWWEYCDKHGNGDHDPNRHSAEFLREYVIARSGEDADGATGAVFLLPDTHTHTHTHHPHFQHSSMRFLGEPTNPQ